MDKRFFLALVLTAIVIVGTPLLFPGTKRPAPIADSTHAVMPARDSNTGGNPAATVPAASAPVMAAQSSNTALNQPAASAATAETTVVRTSRSTYAFSSLGGAPVSVVLDSYPSRHPQAGAGAKVARRVELVRPRTPLMHFRVATPTDTTGFDAAALTAVTGTSATGPTLTYTGSQNGRGVKLEYQFVPDSFLVRVRTAISGAPAGSALLVDLPRSLYSNEADTTDDLNHLAVSFRDMHGEINSAAFNKLDTTVVREEKGPFSWVAERNKYFLVAYRAQPGRSFTTLRMQGGHRVGKVAPEATATVALPIGADGTTGFDMYAGPQDFERLQHLGGDLDQVNPYAGWLHGVVQPFATIVMRALLWMKRTTQLNYGWVLVLFGVLIRLALWPLNQGAMRTSMKMQRLQPELQAIQKKYSDDPKKQQESIMKVYKEHGMSPLSPLMGCLPMLLPMPILFALYFVFQNTIEFRGVSFLWLPDLSLRDPFFITPLLMGVSMFVMSWVGLKGSPPNPQAKMMSYMMPVMLTVLFLNFASGLNLYYAVQNVAAIPQQWLLARERAKNVPVTASTQGPGIAVKKRS